MTDLPKTAIDAGASAIAEAVFEAWGGALAGDGAERLAGAALEAAAPDLAVAENLARLGVDPSEWDTYTNALGLDMSPEQVLAAVRECSTRAELDKLTEDG
jgi:hypothetical protein